MSSSTKPTNVCIAAEHLDALRALSANTRIRQAEYIREALRDVIQKYQGNWQGSKKSNELDYAGLPTLPFNINLPLELAAGLKNLVQKSRIKQSEFIREAIQDLLIKYREQWNTNN